MSEEKKVTKKELLDALEKVHDEMYKALNVLNAFGKQIKPGEYSSEESKFWEKAGSALDVRHPFGTILGFLEDEVRK